ncbi:MAG: glycosyltransferase family 2 protein [Colwellia sp.]|nr:glycosyltransferase family 2 protein [Colwellia sp.]
MIKKIAVILTCFNRREITLSCLAALEQQINVSDISIYLVDDGSYDGTGSAVKKAFPDVNIIKGTGGLYWNGGMRLAWETALASKPDFYLWVNDDSFIYNDAISRLFTCYQELIKQGQSVGAILGSMVDPLTKKLTYGGRLKCSYLNPVKIGSVVVPSAQPQHCDFINGNLILIPASTVDDIGILSKEFTHSMGDFDYGLRAKEAGLNCWVAPGVYGECELNSIEGTWQDKSLSVEERVNKMKSITQLPPLQEWMCFIKRHCGWKWSLLYVDALIRCKLPKVWLFIKRKI